MSPSVDGFIAVSQTGADDEYVFDTAIVVQPGSKYWFYTNDQSAAFLVASDGRQDLYQDGEMYVPGPDNRFVVFHTTMQRTDHHDANFVLRGRPVSR